MSKNILAQWTWMKRHRWCTWNPKQPFINGCFNWMIPNLYIGNGCFTKHQFFNGCLGFQAGVRLFGREWFFAIRVWSGSQLHLSPGPWLAMGTCLYMPIHRPTRSGDKSERLRHTLPIHEISHIGHRCLHFRSIGIHLLFKSTRGNARYREHKQIFFTSALQPLPVPKKVHGSLFYKSLMDASLELELLFLLLSI